MTRRKELPFLKCWDNPEGAEEYGEKHQIECGHWHRWKEYRGAQLGYFLKDIHAEMFAELVRRVLAKEDFISYAEKCQREIFEG